MKRFYNTYYKAKSKTYLKEIKRGVFAKPYNLANVLLLHIGVGLLKLLYILTGIQNLDFEEAQYWTWSKHLDIWYYSKPPMVAYLNWRSEEHTSELQSRGHLVCRLLLEKKHIEV